ncbi:hypothetical protein PC115_g17465 [Phytophthora cactorum]|uniref:Integrase catalytic domain-containing protein n=1 Tax=Phytophthora cactorum TaxID=29920 RepID=A0A8T1B4Z2_9STRA|nr:hypothetical protein PC115_g17465 [Phytophthora cactorum]KAG3140324.1 hypothetical protein C6341_g20060 [Phytophthora cactorum]
MSAGQTSDTTSSVETLNVLTRTRTGLQYRSMEMKNPPTSASELMSLPAMSWMRSAKDLYDGRIEQVCILSDLERMKSEAEELRQLHAASTTESEDTLSAKTKKERFDGQSWDSPSASPFYDVLREYKDVLPDEIPAELPQDKGIQHEIDLVPGTKYCVTRQWPLPRDQVKAIDDFFESRRRAGQVRKSKSPHSAPTFCVKKPQGGWRIVHAYNKLNDATIPAQTPIPRKDVIIDSIAKSTIYSAFDLRNGFYHILMRESDIPLTTVSTPSGMLWEWLVMTQGLKNAPATFNRCVTHLLRSVRDFAPSYFDNVLNVVADALSRQPDDAVKTADANRIGVECVSAPSSSLIDDVKTAYASDAEAKQFLSYASAPSDEARRKLAPHLRARAHRYRVHEGLLLSSAVDDYDLRMRIMYEYHDTPTAGHPGREKTFVLLTRDFYWNHQYKWVRKYVRACEVCQRVKPAAFSQAPLQSLPTPSECWQHISMDFVYGLPPDSKRRTGVVVFVDRFSKMEHLAVVPAEVTAVQTVRLFVDMVFKHHGMPLDIVSDRDPRFTARFWQEVFTLLGTQLSMSSAGGPQTNGQTECVNQVLGDLLKSSHHRSATVPSRLHASSPPCLRGLSPPGLKRHSLHTNRWRHRLNKSRGIM